MYYFVVNPASRSGKGLKIWEKTEEILKEKKIEYESYILTAPGEAREMAQFLSLNKTPCTVVIVGGDGTINEFLSGLPTFEGITLGYLPTGSGNDFARGMHLPAKPEDALDLILNPEKFRHINIGITSSGDEKKYFAISSGIGFDAAICYESNASALKSILNKIHAGKLIYLINALRMLFALKPCSMRVLLKYEGGGFMLCPKASPVDNYLDLIVVDNMPKAKVLAVLPTALFGKHTNFKGVHIYRCRRAVIQSENKACVHMDGEHFGFCKKVSFDLAKEKLKFIVD